ncbi:extracellular solute-binding protein [Streptomyces sp. SP17BM10]|uniref:extracellular solute-binding protein n=1 Tax=Streptomyces sp. SP17BM10 TaxID=3002530 RepID=UPI002E77F8AC|nr:extracellular solute-binding protein [Streptomyces sp. SP17BM10]MEE1789130.1 extracellular solute-binding protein [Streptomyces sp. SP17BM10]
MNRRAHVPTRVLGTALAGALVLSAVSACGGQGDGPVTIRLVAADYGENADTGSKLYWDEVVRGFEAQNPGIKVDVDVESWTDIGRKVDDLISSGKSPDLLQTGGFADQVAAGRLYPAADVLSLDTQSKFMDSFAHAGQVLGTQYGIPFVSSSRVLFYNKALFKQAGISQPPATWSELRQDAEKIKAKAPGVTPYGLPLGPEEAPAESMLWTLSGGGLLSDDVGNYTIDSAQNQATFSWLKSNLVSTGLTYPEPGKMNRTPVFQDFASGKVAMLNGHPTLLRMATAGNVDFGTAPIPRKDGLGKTGSLGVADWMMAFKANGHKDQIKKFLSFVFMRENQLKFDERYNLLPVTQDAFGQMSSDPKHADLRQFATGLTNASFYPFGDPAWADVSNRIKAGIGDAVTGDPKQVLTGLQDAAVKEAARLRK